MTALRDILQSLTYFQGISQVELDRLVASVVHRRVENGEHLFFEGEPSSGLWIVAEGHVKIYKLNPDGAEHILHILGPGATFNDIAAMDGGSNPANAAALTTPGAIWLLPTNALADLLMSNPRMAMNIIRLMARRVRTLVGQIEDLALYSVVVRLARFLLKQAQDPTLSGPGVTRTAIAAHINTTPQTLSVALRELEHSGAITFDRQRVRIVRNDTLRSIAML
ncbi:MAG: Crp/Fnr family transcriptional regulator [Chloroflexi bacterium]|nr:Crp/Fnr family transcriptional regulator [Chloroflexota bacterium]